VYQKVGKQLLLDITTVVTRHNRCSGQSKDVQRKAADEHIIVLSFLIRPEVNKYPDFSRKNGF